MGRNSNDFGYTPEKSQNIFNEALMQRKYVLFCGGVTICSCLRRLQADSLRKHEKCMILKCDDVLYLVIPCAAGVLEILN